MCDVYFVESMILTARNSLDTLRRYRAVSASTSIDSALCAPAVRDGRQWRRADGLRRRNSSRLHRVRARAMLEPASGVRRVRLGGCRVGDERAAAARARPVR